MQCHSPPVVLFEVITYVHNAYASDNIVQTVQDTDTVLMEVVCDQSIIALFAMIMSDLEWSFGLEFRI